ncbi:MAG: aminopeptidase P family protein [Rhodospirillales bacterium]|jgi:Xaa-Pro dipeptidase|nr:aminopeptidase P family protein [Rhodospirillales bacterium]MBT4040966.1 aminopeptidase P family protein [Rhodospirillales bacterium]MBT4625632.1 aminopeptidase P family protein [Rhodospirillales bacterium]MBT5350199.1 aminopeptidase P family protein [Rhodospirillales bacterium]MBT5522019.1 aminopeptidase P family protein [Rhodospirillales bacterium]
MAPQFAAFSRSEHDERLSLARQVIKGAGIDACILSAPENIYYFCGYDSWVSVNSPQSLIFTTGEDDPTIILRDVDITLATETTRTRDIRTYNMVAESYAERVKNILQEKGITGGRVAIEFASYALPMSLGDGLRAALGGIELVDSTGLLGDLRHIKSPAEMAYMEEAARYSNLGLAAMKAATAPGVSEISVAAEIESAIRRAGSDFWAIPTELSSGTRSAGGHATPRNRLIETGDLVHAEFAGVAARYHATAIQTIAVGDPSARSRELYDIGIASLIAGMDAVKPGVSVGAVEEASLVPLRAHGLEHAAMMRFGYGIGIAYPPIWLETLQIARGFDYVLKPGMAFVLHSCLELPDENLGVVQGGTYVLEESGLRLLAGAGACELEVL